MTITQARLHSVVQAAEAIKAQHLATCRTCEALLASALPGPDLIQALAREVMAPEARIAGPLRVLEAERIRYHYTHKRNEQERRRIARRRAEAGLPEPAPQEPKWPEALPDPEVPEPTFEQMFGASPEVASQGALDDGDRARIAAELARIGAGPGGDRGP